MSQAAQEFLRRAVRKSADLTHQQIIRRATQQSGRRLGKASFQDWEAARQKCHEIKSEALISVLIIIFWSLSAKFKNGAATYFGPRTPKRPGNI